jgi:hypothetical protein
MHPFLFADAIDTANPPPGTSGTYRHPSRDNAIFKGCFQVDGISANCNILSKMNKILGPEARLRK